MDETAGLSASQTFESGLARQPLVGRFGKDDVIAVRVWKARKKAVKSFFSEKYAL